MSKNLEGQSCETANKNQQLEVIKIVEYNGNQAVNARDLHEFLGSQREFATWIKDRIQKYGFVENQDFEVFDNFVKNLNGGCRTFLFRGNV